MSFENGLSLNKSEISKLSECYVVGTLNLYLGMPDSLQKELALSDPKNIGCRSEGDFLDQHRHTFVQPKPPYSKNLSNLKFQKPRVYGLRKNQLGTADSTHKRN